MPARVILARHGETQDEDSLSSGTGRIGGWKDFPLNARGRTQSRTLAKRLVKETPQRIVSSDLVRAIDTARAIQRATSAPLNVSKSLRTWHLGEYEGQVISDVKDKILDLVAKKFTPPPGESETFEDFSQRVIKFFSMILDKARKDEATIVLVTHGRPISVMTTWLNHGVKGLTPDAVGGKKASVEAGHAMMLTPQGNEWLIAKMGDLGVG